MEYYYIYETIIGKLKITELDNAIIEISCGNDKNHFLGKMKETDLINNVFIQIEEYLEGRRKIFNIPIKLEGTLFQKDVWNALKEIPYGDTKTYKDIAINIGHPKAFRAVGGALNKNPIMIVLPCHRVIGSNKSLVGFAGGLELKKKLLKLENNHYLQCCREKNNLTFY